MIPRKATKNVQLPASAATMNPTRAISENHFTHGCTRFAKRSKRLRISRPAMKGRPMIKKTSTSICHGLSSTAVSSPRAVGCNEPQKATDRGSTKM